MTNAQQPQLDYTKPLHYTSLNCTSPASTRLHQPQLHLTSLNYTTVKQPAFLSLSLSLSLSPLLPSPLWTYLVSTLTLPSLYLSLSPSPTQALGHELSHELGSGSGR